MPAFFRAASAAILCIQSTIVFGQDFSEPWLVVPEHSTMTATHIKGEGIAETSYFPVVGGSIEPNGQFTLELDMLSLRSGIDIRDTRMKFLLFETFNYPTLRIEGAIDVSSLFDRRPGEKFNVSANASINLLGEEIALEDEAKLTVHFRSSEQVSVTTAAPILLQLENFGLLPGLEKLEETASIEIEPVAIVTFDLGLEPRAFETQPIQTSATSPDVSCDQATDEILAIGETDGINFVRSSIEFTSSSWSTLEDTARILRDCEAISIEVAGHTDSIGSAAVNQRLSELRARAVVLALVGLGAQPNQLVAVGYGESRPLTSNDTETGRELNSRIEFNSL